MGGLADLYVFIVSERDQLVCQAARGLNIRREEWDLWKPEEDIICIL